MTRNRGNIPRVQRVGLAPRLLMRGATCLIPVLSGLLAFVVLGVPEAYAAPITPPGGSGSMTAQVLHAAGDVMGNMLCVESLDLGHAFDLGPHAEGSSRCDGMRGLGIAVLALAALVVIALGRMRLHTEQKRLDLARHLVEQGIEPPPGLLMGPARSDLRKGIVLLFAGAGIFAAGLLLGDRGLAAGALVPEFIGVGYLVSFWLAARPPGAGAGGG
jgi:hypothetical protein